MGGRGSNGNRNRALITSESSNYGSPGVYEVYRVGDLSAPNGLIFLGADKTRTQLYYEGRSYRKSMKTETYIVDIKNPLVIRADDETQAVIQAYTTLNPDRKVPQTDAIGNLKGGYSTWQKLDKQNAKVLKSSGHDAIIYIIEGKGREVQLVGEDRKRLKLRKGN